MALLSTFINYQLFLLFANPGLINYHQTEPLLDGLSTQKERKKNPRIPKNGTYLLLETKHQFLRQLETSGIGNLFSLRL